MASVAFWGMQHGLGVTSNIAAIAASLAQDYRLRSLITQPQFNDHTLEWAFRTSMSRHNQEYLNKDGMMTGSGMDGLERAVRSSKLERESIKNNTLVVDPDKLDLLQGSSKTSLSQFENSQDIMEIVLQRAKEYYDTVLIDVHSGTNNSMIHTIMNNADMIIVCVDQNIHVLNKFFKEREQWPIFLQNKPHMLMIGKYDPNSKYRIKNIANKYGYKEKILTIPYNAGFKDHYNDGDVKGFVSRNINVGKYDENYFFIQETRRAVQTILTEIGINTQVKHVDSLEKGVS